MMCEKTEGAFVQGIGFFMMEEYTTDEKGLVVQQGTWDYKIPTVDTIPRHFNVEILNTGHHKDRVLSSKGTLGFSLCDFSYNCYRDFHFDILIFLSKLSLFVHIKSYIKHFLRFLIRI